MQVVAAARGPCRLARAQGRRHQEAAGVAVVVRQRAVVPHAETGRRGAGKTVISTLVRYGVGYARLEARRVYVLVSDLVRHDVDALEVATFVDRAAGGGAHPRDGSQAWERRGE